MGAVTITEAEGYADLGMWRDACEALEALSSEVRATPRALRVRLRCCPPLGAWGIGEHVAGLLRDGSRCDKACAAGFYHANARRLLKAGDRRGAGESIKAAMEAFPECRRLMLLDAQLVAEVCLRSWSVRVLG